ncbi:MAG: uracil phosphoribosyltransferase [Bacteroidota bacterium]|nr:uracil phosphoribosyltransferase [Bacteroidota bacterium]|tara:strand:+ start:376 stop:603 length:228 start_codon:yes stop_codon:yes gene_type:complete
MTEFFYFIEYLFVEILFIPLDFLRSLELESWGLANSINFFFIITVICALSYWTLQLMGFSKRKEEDEDPSAHSFL